MFWHGVRGGDEVRQVRRGELRCLLHPETHERLGVQYEQSLQTKTNNPTAIRKQSSSAAGSNHVVPIVENLGWYKICDKYVSKLPAADPAFIRAGLRAGVSVPDRELQLYAPLLMKHIDTMPSGASTWEEVGAWYHKARPRGRDTSTQLVKNATEPQGLKGRLSNGSGRVTLCCNLSDSGIPQTLAMSFSRHKTPAALGAYTVRHNNVNLKKVTSHIVASPVRSVIGTVDVAAASLTHAPLGLPAAPRHDSPDDEHRPDDIQPPVSAIIPFATGPTVATVKKLTPNNALELISASFAK